LTDDPHSRFYQPPSTAPLPPRYITSRRHQDTTSSSGGGHIRRHHRHDDNHRQSSDQYNPDSSMGELSDSVARSSNVDWHSENTLRSNYFAEGSMAAERLVPVHMQRYRGMQMLDRHTVKGGFNLISRRSKERKLADRQEALRIK